MKKSVLSSEEIQEMKDIAFKMLWEEEIQKDVDLIESEFTDMTNEELFDIVYELTFCNYKYHKMNEVDKFDYLVDEILIMQGLMQRAE